MLAAHLLTQVFLGFMLFHFLIKFLSELGFVPMWAFTYLVTVGCR